MRNVRKVKRGATKAKKGLTGWVKKLTPANLLLFFKSKDGRRLMWKAAGSFFLLLFMVALFYAKDLPSPSKINARLGAQTTKFYDRTGQTIIHEVFGTQNRSLIGFEKMPDNIKQATIAIEDKNFYKHGAFSAFGIVRASFVNLFQRDRGIQGGSTITQQYVKNALLKPERTFSRKIRELMLSMMIEQFYKKDDILKLYLNEIPYGANAYGIEAACRTYFSYHGTADCAAQLTLDEAAILAAIPRAPTYYSPYGQHKDALQARQRLILDLMVEQKYVTKDEAEAAKKIDTIAKMPKNRNLAGGTLAPHFVLYVQETLEAKYGTRVVTEGGLKVITTLDLDKQKFSEQAIEKNMANVRRLGGSNAALVSADPKTGQIYSMVGSYDYSDQEFGSFNVAIANRQPGSSFKPFVYAAAFGNKTGATYGPGTTLYDVTTDFGGGYKPENYSDQTYGVVSMRQALAGSLNISAVKTLYLAGIKESIVTANRMGISTIKESDVDNYGLSLVLGSGDVKLVDMVNAYESFANGGVHHESTPILKITNSKGDVLEEFKEKKGKDALDPQVAYLISNVLSDNGARAYVFGNLLNLSGGRPGAVKTGTTENYRDAWTVGYTPSLVAGVWTGNNDNKSMTRAASAVAAPIWRDFMNSALAGTPVEQFARPSGIKEVALDTNTGKAASPESKATRTDVFASWYKATSQDTSRSATIDKLSKKLATECTPELAKEAIFASEMHAEIPPNDPAYGRWEPPVAALAQKMGYSGGGNLPTESDDVHKCSDTKPTVELTVTSQGGGNYKVKAVVGSGTFTANKLDISLDDQIISTQQISGSTTYEFDHTIVSNGAHSFKALVTDAGLYTAVDTETVTVSSAGSPSFSGLSPTDGSNVGVGIVTFSWQSYTDANKYELWIKRGGSDYASSPYDSNTNSKAVTIIAGSYTWFVKAFQGSNLLRTTPTYSFSSP